MRYFGRFALILAVLAIAAAAFALTDAPAYPNNGSKMLLQPVEEYVPPPNYYAFPKGAQAAPQPNTSYFYAFDRIFIFGFHDGTTFTLYDQGGNILAASSLSDGGYVRFDVPVGTYRLEASDLVSVLVGAADDNITGYHALTDASIGTGIKFYSYQRGGFGDSREAQYVSSYGDNNLVEVFNMVNGTLLASRVLADGETWKVPPAQTRNRYVKTVSTGIISVLNFTDIGYSVPSKSGLFTGTEFHGYMGTTSGSGDLLITSYTDGNNYEVRNSKTSAIVKSGTLASGQTAFQTFNELYFTVTADAPVAVQVNPFSGAAGDYHYMDIMPDKDGTRIGTEFFFTSVNGQFDLFSYLDDNDIVVTDTKNTLAPGDDVVVWSGTLGEGGHQLVPCYTSTWHVTGTQPLSVFNSFGVVAGAEFIPLYGVLVECDNDLDGYEGPQCNGDDCNDFDPDINPGETEIRCDRIDQNCDGLDFCDCQNDGECDDGIFCNGAEVCDMDENVCGPGDDPCADDGAWCNGDEACDEAADTCVQVAVPDCADDGVFCNGAESCDEVNDKCGTTGPQCLNDGQYCNGVEFCDEETDMCTQILVPCLDDALFCNGDDGCDEDADICTHSGNPCPEGESCDEFNRSCETPEDPADDDDDEATLDDDTDSDPDIPVDEDEGGPGWPEGAVTGGACCGC
ncbi:hypothetical protein K8I61_18955 [bacterium]|nr:hypothetical protein [bacterium]